jgi:uncharacterized protein
MQKKKYTYEQFTGDILSIVRQIHTAEIHPTFVVGISRGGLVPAVFLAQWFNCPVKTIYCSTRDNNELDVSQLLSLPDDSTVLIVDDIIDSGKTIETIEKELPVTLDYHFAALWHNIQVKNEIRFSAREINRADDQRWIVFPWEEFWISE